ncbi:hypothetical protein DU484_18605 (plasmid) [Haloplanus rubicundus]|uniref:Uncharacterized protein n=1 Tax=Haloplanus rubicundus TaxID=1547898 RepID=A0A345EIA6_9EURY|nr:hypothetical protein DU484_18605 [Haloplanus rubicundus]
MRLDGRLAILRGETEIDSVFADGSLWFVRVKHTDSECVFVGAVVDCDDECLAESDIGVGFAVAKGG